jgi:hypothetical protein
MLEGGTSSRLEILQAEGLWARKPPACGGDSRLDSPSSGFCRGSLEAVTRSSIPRFFSLNQSRRVRRSPQFAGRHP